MEKELLRNLPDLVEQKIGQLMWSSVYGNSIEMMMKRQLSPIEMEYLVTILDPNLLEQVLSLWSNLSDNQQQIIAVRWSLYSNFVKLAQVFGRNGSTAARDLYIIKAPLGELFLVDTPKFDMVYAARFLFKFAVLLPRERIAAMSSPLQLNHTLRQLGPSEIRDVVGLRTDYDTNGATIICEKCGLDDLEWVYKRINKPNLTTNLTSIVLRRMRNNSQRAYFAMNLNSPQLVDQFVCLWNPHWSDVSVSQLSDEAYSLLLWNTQLDEFDDLIKVFGPPTGHAAQVFQYRTQQKRTYATSTTVRSILGDPEQLSREETRQLISQLGDLEHFSRHDLECLLAKTIAQSQKFVVDRLPSWFRLLPSLRRTQILSRIVIVDSGLVDLLTQCPSLNTLEQDLLLDLTTGFAPTREYLKMVIPDLRRERARIFCVDADTGLFSLNSWAVQINDGSPETSLLLLSLDWASLDDLTNIVDSCTDQTPEWQCCIVAGLRMADTGTKLLRLCSKIRSPTPQTRKIALCRVSDVNLLELCDIWRGHLSLYDYWIALERCLPDQVWAIFSLIHSPPQDLVRLALVRASAATRNLVFQSIKSPTIEMATINRVMQSSAHIGQEPPEWKSVQEEMRRQRIQDIQRQLEFEAMQVAHQLPQLDVDEIDELLDA